LFGGKCGIGAVLRSIRCSGCGTYRFVDVNDRANSFVSETRPTRSRQPRTHTRTLLSRACWSESRSACEASSSSRRSTTPCRISGSRKSAGSSSIHLCNRLNALHLCCRVGIAVALERRSSGSPEWRARRRVLRRYRSACWWSCCCRCCSTRFRICCKTSLHDIKLGKASKNDCSNR